MVFLVILLCCVAFVLAGPIAFILTLLLFGVVGYFLASFIIGFLISIWPIVLVAVMLLIGGLVAWEIKNKRDNEAYAAYWRANPPPPGPPIPVLNNREMVYLHNATHADEWTAHDIQVEDDYIKAQRGPITTVDRPGTPMRDLFGATQTAIKHGIQGAAIGAGAAAAWNASRRN